jgi:hypothetical protein
MHRDENPPTLLEDELMSVVQTEACDGCARTRQEDLTLSFQPIRRKYDEGVGDIQRGMRYSYQLERQKERDKVKRSDKSWSSI